MEPASGYIGTFSTFLCQLASEPRFPFKYRYVNTCPKGKLIMK